MTHIIVKDGRVAVSGGRVVTSAGGAPCCCGGGGPNDDWPCDQIAPSCFRVTLSGWTASGLVTGDCFFVPGFGSVFPSDSRSLSVSGFDGTHYLNGSESGVLYCSVINERANNPAVQGIVYEAFTIRVFLACDNTTNQWGIGGVIVDTERFGGAGCNDGVLFNWGTNNPTPIRDGLTLTQADNSRPIFGNVSPGTITIETVDCTENPTTYYAALCGDPSQTITVDITDRPINQQWCIHNEERYALTGERSEDPPVPVIWDALPCPVVVGDWPLARRCGGQSLITYDPATRPPNGVTLFVGQLQYIPVAGFAATPPTAGVWSPDPCPSGLCAGLVPNDPLCAFPIYRDCPQCVGFDVGDPQPEPDFDLQEGGTIPGLGDMVAEAIRTISLNTILPCSACERRKQVLNRFGERAGRSILRILNW